MNLLSPLSPVSLPPPPPTPAPLADRIATFSGRKYLFLLWLIAHPTEHMTDGLRSIGSSIQTLYSWKRKVPGYAEVVEAVRSYTGNLRTEAARALFHDATVPISQAMVNRALENGKDAQRAGERILEAVGVLRKEGDLAPGTEAVDILMLKLRRRAGST